MSEPSKAVFLSYASQDANTVGRIAEALRAAGIEVWFDQNELRGGDAWDAKIRKQIRECALFVPIISANTQARLEGYYRLEWKLAVDRSHLMSEEKAFLVPVVMDATTDAEAKVPDKFREVQWTRLANPGDLAPGFSNRINNLLATVTLVPFATAGPFATAANRVAPTRLPTASPRRVRSQALWGAVAVAILLGGGVWWLLRDSAPAPSAAKSAREKPATAARPAAADPRSIAVLPFENLSLEPESAYLADAMHDEMLTAVAKISALKVIGRTSVLPFADVKRRNLRQIAADLGVATFVEGRVRRMGNRVRIAVELVDAQSSRQLWTDSYERELTDVFAVQAASPRRSRRNSTRR